MGMGGANIIEPTTSFRMLGSLGPAEHVFPLPQIFPGCRLPPSLESREANSACALFLWFPESSYKGRHTVQGGEGDLSLEV